MHIYQSQNSFIEIMTALFCSACFSNSDYAQKQVQQVLQVENFVTAVEHREILKRVES